MSAGSEQPAAFLSLSSQRVRVTTLPRPCVPLPQLSRTQNTTCSLTRSILPLHHHRHHHHRYRATATTMKSTGLQIRARRNTVPLPLVDDVVDATQQLSPDDNGMLPTPPPTPLVQQRKLATRASSANFLPQHTVYVSQHLQSETNALGLDLGDIIRQPQYNALGPIQVEVGMLALGAEDGTPRNGTLFGTTDQTGPQEAGMGMSPSATLHNNTAEEYTTEPAAVSDTTLIKLNSSPPQFDRGHTGQNDDDEKEREEVGDKTDEGTDFIFPIERAFIQSPRVWISLQVWPWCSGSTGVGDALTVHVGG